MTRPLIAVAFIAFLLAGQGKARKLDPSSPQEQDHTMAPSEGSSLGCKASLATARWKATQPVFVSIAITNRSGRDFESVGVPAFYLKPVGIPDDTNRQTEQTYFAFWNIHTGETLPPSETVSLHLRSGKSFEKRVNLAMLFWSRRNYSVLPHTPLFKTVPAGEYLFRTEISSADGKTLCSSKEVKVSLE